MRRVRFMAMPPILRRECNWLRHAFKFMAAALLDDEQASDLALNLRGNYDSARLC